MKFQSLFLWIFRSYYNSGYDYFENFCVSILVLMDLPFLRLKNNDYEIVLQEVSILVLMDLPFLLNIWKIIKRIIICFNPCSYGSSVLTWVIQLPYIRSDMCFNPCSYGSSVLTKKNWLYIQTRKTMFQSLFLWIFRSYIKMSRNNWILS